MMHYRMLVSALVFGLVLGACGGKQAPEAASPDGQQTVTQERDVATEEAARRADEERRAEEAQRAREAAAAAEILARMVHFDLDRFDIRGDAEQVLMEKLPILRANPDVRIRIDGHADERGSTEYNLALGMRRANAVRQFLIGYGIESNRFEIQSFGKERPFVQRSNEEAWALNRRAEFNIIAGADRLAMPQR